MLVAIMMEGVGPGVKIELKRSEKKDAMVGEMVVCEIRGFHQQWEMLSNNAKPCRATRLQGSEVVLLLDASHSNRELVQVAIPAVI